MNPKWARKFYDQHGIWPIAGGSGDDEPTEPEPEPEEEPAGDPRIKELSDEAASYRVRSKEAETRAETAEEELRATRIELAVRREGAARAKPFADLDVVMKVLDLDSIAIDDDGQPVEVGAALDRIADRHPYLLDDEQPGQTKIDPRTQVRSGGSQNRDRNRGTGIDRAKLERKYPGLRRGRR